tara:strand:- start:172 stop:1221 length:1050 start_codon:yes stop_codon:yes gene_type:complete
MVPYQSRRFVDRLLQRANIDAQWIRPPSVEDILKRDRERVLEDPALHDEISEDERIFAKEILSRHSPEQIATALLRQHMSNQTAPEELLDEGPPSKPQKQDRNFKNSIWFSLSVGSNDDAEPRWLLPMLCRTTHLTKSDIGAIRVQPAKTFIELSADCVDKFNEALGSSKKLEKTIKVVQLEKRPEISDASRVRRSRDEKPKRFSTKSNPRSDYKNNKIKDDVGNARITPFLKHEKPKKDIERVEPKGNLKGDRPKVNLNTNAPKNTSKIDLNDKKLDEDFDKFIRQLDEIDTRPPSKGFKKKNKRIKSSKRTEDQKTAPPPTSVGIKKRRATKRKPMPSQPTRKSRRQ